MGGGSPPAQGPEVVGVGGATPSPLSGNLGSHWTGISPGFLWSFRRSVVNLTGQVAGAGSGPERSGMGGYPPLLGSEGEGGDPLRKNNRVGGRPPYPHHTFSNTAARFRKYHLLRVSFSPVFSARAMPSPNSRFETSIMGSV